jgi:hypothetical protein
MEAEHVDGNGASGLFTSHVPTIGGASFLATEIDRQAVEQRDTAANPIAAACMRISLEHSSWLKPRFGGALRIGD